MNETEIQRLGTSPLLKVLDRISQLLPVNASAYSTLNSTMLRESDAADVGQALLYLQRVGLDPIVSVSVTIDDKNPVSTYIHSYHSLHGQLTNTVKKSRIVKIAPTSHMVMSKSAYSNEDKMASYMKSMVGYLSVIHPNDEAKNKSVQLVRQVVDLEAKIAMQMPQQADLTDVSVSKISIDSSLLTR
jgi:hypothetical protein